MSFYCKKVCGDPDFSIKDWNRKREMCDNIGLGEYEKNKILHPETDPCKKQCFDCMVVVGERRIKTSKF